MTIDKGPPAASVKTLFLVPFLARSVGLGPISSPPERAFPSHPSVACHSQLISASSSHSAASNAQIISKRLISTRALKSAMDGGVVAVDFWDVIPLATSAKAEDNTVKHPARISARAPGSLWRVILIE